MKRILIVAYLLAVPAAAQNAGGGWEYGREGTGDAMATYAAVPGTADDGARVALRFSSGDLTGRQLHLQELPSPADCEAGCRIQMTIDGSAAETVRATIFPNSDTTLSLRNARDIWRSLEDAQSLEFAYPDGDGDIRKIVFDVGGIDITALPGWD